MLKHFDRTTTLIALALLLVAVLLSATLKADLLAARVTVATTATLVCTAVNNGGYCLIKNAGANSIFLGDATVTTANGFELATGAAISVSLKGKERVYGIVAAATEVAHVIRSPKP